MILTHQTVSIVVMTISGLFIAATIDAFRFFWLNRNTTRLYKYHRFFEFFLWIGFGIVTFYLLFTIKGGVWRFVDPIAQFFGILLYEKVMKRPFRIVGRVLDFIIIRPIKWLGLLIIGIIRFIIKIIVNFIKFLIKPFVKLFQKIIKK
jgi:hypothetical protein